MGSESMTAAPAVPEERALGFFERLQGIYFEPRKTFADIGRRGGWIGMYILISLLVMTASWAVTTRSDPQALARKAIEGNPFTKNMPEEQKEQQIAAMASSTFQRYSQIIFAPLGVIVNYLIVSGVLLLIFVLMGTSIGFKKSLAVTIWAMGGPGILLLILATVFVLLKDPDSLDVFNVVNNVVSNPSIAISEKEHPILNSALASIDIFAFWTAYLLAVGFSTLSRGALTVGKAFVGVAIPWALYVAGKLGFVAMFS